MTRALAALVALLALAGGAGAAHANGKFPEAGQLVVDPDDPAHLVMRTTFGLMVSRDGGDSWDWICEAGAGYADVEPPTAVAAGGAVVLALPDGIARSDASGCAWDRATGGIAGLQVVDLTWSPGATGGALLAITFDPTLRRTTLWRSTDDGASWQVSGAAMPDGFIGYTLDAAPADAARIYVSGLLGDDTVGTLARTDDAGESWELVDIEESGVAEIPFIGAMHPTDARTLLVRLAGSPGRLLVTRDAGDTWQEAFVGAGFLRGLALSPDGEQILVGGELDGVWRGSLSTLDFERVSDQVPMCLTWTEQGVFACGHVFFNDAAAVSRSRDEGETFTSLLCLADLAGPLACGEATSVAGTCDADWPAVEAQLARASCAQSEGGAGGNGDGGAATTTSTTGDNPPIDDNGGCAVGERERPAGGTGLLIALAALTARRRGRPGAQAQERRPSSARNRSSSASTRQSRSRA